MCITKTCKEDDLAIYNISYVFLTTFNYLFSRYVSYNGY